MNKTVLVFLCAQKKKLLLLLFIFRIDSLFSRYHLSGHKLRGYRFVKWISDFCFARKMLYIVSMAWTSQVAFNIDVSHKMFRMTTMMMIIIYCCQLARSQTHTHTHMTQQHSVDCHKMVNNENCRIYFVVDRLWILEHTQPHCTFN